MIKRTAFNYIIAATLVVGLGANSAMAATYPPKTNPEAPITKISKHFKPSKPIARFSTKFNNTLLKLKVDQPASFLVGVFRHYITVSVTILLPDGKTEKLPNLSTDGNGNVLVKPLYYAVKGTYAMTLIGGKALKTITFEVK